MSGMRREPILCGKCLGNWHTCDCRNYHGSPERWGGYEFTEGLTEHAVDDEIWKKAILANAGIRRTIERNEHHWEEAKTLKR
jgi:hypothetical protein